MKRRLPALCLLICCPVLLFAQTDSLNRLDEQVVTGFKDEHIKATSLNLESYSLRMLEKKRTL